MRIITGILLSSALLLAQLNTAQRVQDFQVLADLVARYYAPLEWKRTVHNVDGLRIGPWLERVRAAQNDTEFRLICAQYMGQFKDGHTNFILPSSFVADALIRADLYEGKLLIYNLSTAQYPPARFPLLTIGNEVVSLDGRPALEIVDELVRINPAGSGRGARRTAALNLFARSQQIYPDAPSLPGRSQLVVRNPAGEEATYTIEWIKAGSVLGPTPPLAKESFASQLSSDGQWMEKPTMLSLRSDLASLHASTNPEEPDPIKAVLGLGARNPYFALPANFVLRRGAAPADNFFSGTYMADGLRIGYLRIPTFDPASINAALTEFSNEITFLRANTDGLVVDVSRSTGGFANLALSYFARLTTRPYYATQFEWLPTTTDVLTYDFYAEISAALSRDRWVIEKWQWAAEEMRRAWLAGGRTRTIPIGITETGASILTRGPLVDDNFVWQVAGQPAGYDKPLIVLADDLSVSGGDLFPSLFQDNQRGLVVGMRTGGLGGTVVSFYDALPHTQAFVRLTTSLMVRKNPVRVPGFPVAPYVEDLGVVPDVELDYQTRSNLMNRGADFVAGFTRVIVDHIRASARPTAPAK